MAFKLNDKLVLGVATSATQIEGGDTNNTWYEWTKNHDKTKDGSTPFLANSHWVNYKDHIDLMAHLKIESYRMSIEWSRIEPKEDEFSLENMNHYIDEIKYLKEKGISVIVTLHHFANPIWFDAKGGFKNKKYCLERFKKYVTFVVSNLKGLVKDFCTINEPNVYAFLTFHGGCWVQEERSWRTTRRVLINLGLCHIEAYKIIHSIIEDSIVGFAMSVTKLNPLRKNNILDKIGTWFFDRRFNIAVGHLMCYGKRIFPLGTSRKTGVYFDYYGINYYTSHIVKRFKELIPDNFEFTDFGWPITPFELKNVCERYYKKYKKYIFILENGISDASDSKRPNYIYGHLKAIKDLDYVKRYYHWSFMDNFEWKEGYTQRFGLVEYDYDNQTYKPRPSAYLYQEIIKNKAITNEMIKKYKIKVEEVE